MKKERYTTDESISDSHSSIHSYNRKLSSLFTKGIVFPVIILCLLAIGISGLIVYGFAYTKTESTSDAHAAQIESILAEKLSYVNAIAAGLSDYRLTDRNEVLYYLNAMTSSNEYISAIYNCYGDNSYIISGNLLRADNFSNITNSAWYKNALSAPQGITISDPHIDVNTGKPYITISKIVYAYTSVASIIGIDIYIDDILSIVEGYSGTNEYTYILSNGTTLPLHPVGKSYKNFSSVVFSNSTVLGNDYDNELSFISSNTLNYTGWQIVHVHSVLPYITGIIAICAGFLLLALMLILIIHKSISNKILILIRPLSSIAKRARAISNGDFSCEGEADEEYDYPAIKELKIFDKVLSNIATTLKESLEVLVKGTNAIINDTAFNMPATLKGDFVLIKDSLVTIKKAMNQSADDIDAKSQSIVEYSNKLENYIQSTKKKASKEASTLDDISNNLSTVNLHSHRINLSADTVKEAASITNSNLMRGNREMKDLLNAMEQIEASYTSITSLIYDINTFSEQTNLLSLNASIEAARMGDFGKEYASVADEINMLSAACSKSINKIELLINDSTAAVERGRETIKQTSESITKGISDSQNTKYNVDEIVFIVEQQQETISDIEYKLKELKNSISVEEE